MNRLILVIIFLGGAMALCFAYVTKQVESTFRIKFITTKIDYYEGRKEIRAIFHFSAKDSVDFRKEVLFPDIILIGDSGNKVAFTPTKDNINVLIQRDHIEQTITYALVKDKVDLEVKPFYLASFIFQNLPKETIKKMIFTFPVKNSADSDNRENRTFEFELK